MVFDKQPHQLHTVCFREKNDSNFVFHSIKDTLCQFKGDDEVKINHIFRYFFCDTNPYPSYLDYESIWSKQNAKTTSGIFWLRYCRCFFRLFQTSTKLWISRCFQMTLQYKQRNSLLKIKHIQMNITQLLADFNPMWA